MWESWIYSGWAGGMNPSSNLDSVNLNEALLLENVQLSKSGVVSTRGLGRTSDIIVPMFTDQATVADAKTASVLFCYRNSAGGLNAIFQADEVGNGIYSQGIADNYKQDATTLVAATSRNYSPLTTLYYNGYFYLYPSGAGYTNQPIYKVAISDLTTTSTVVTLFDNLHIMNAVLYKDRVWLLCKDLNYNFYLYFSDVGDPDAFNGLNVIALPREIFSGMTETSIGLATFGENTYFLLGSSLDDYRIEQNNKMHPIKPSGFDIFKVGLYIGKDGIYRYDISNSLSIPCALTNSTNDTVSVQVTAGTYYDPSTNKLYLGDVLLKAPYKYPITSPTKYRGITSVDLDTFAIHNWIYDDGMGVDQILPAQNIDGGGMFNGSFIFRNYKDTSTIYTQGWYLVLGSWVNSFLEFSTPRTNTFTSRLFTRWENFGTHLEKEVREIIIYSEIATTADIKVYADLNYTTPIFSSTGYSLVAGENKFYLNGQKKATHFAIEVSSLKDIKISKAGYIYLSNTQKVIR